MKCDAVLRLHPNPIVDEVRVEVMAEGDAGNRGSGLDTRLNDLEQERRVGSMRYPIKRLELVPT